MLTKEYFLNQRKFNSNDTFKSKSGSKNNIPSNNEKSPDIKSKENKILNSDLTNIIDQSAFNPVPKFDIEDTVELELTNDETTKLARAAHNLRRSYFNRAL